MNQYVTFISHLSSNQNINIADIENITVKIGSTTFKTTYIYTDVNRVNKAKLQKLSHPNGREMSYTYDKNNNITSIQEGNKMYGLGEQLAEMA